MSENPIVIKLLYMKNIIKYQIIATYFFTTKKVPLKANTCLTLVDCTMFIVFPGIWFESIYQIWLEKLRSI